MTNRHLPHTKRARNEITPGVTPSSVSACCVGSWLSVCLCGWLPLAGWMDGWMDDGSIGLGRSVAVGRSVGPGRAGRSDGGSVSKSKARGSGPLPTHPPTHPSHPPSLPSLPTPTPNLPLTRRARWTSRVLYEVCVCPRRAALPAACAACLLRAAALTHKHGTCTARASSAARCSCASHSTGAAFFICETRSGLERHTLITRPLTRRTLLFSLLLSSLDLQPNPN